jgi:hypothetical protein
VERDNNKVFEFASLDLFNELIKEGRMKYSENEVQNFTREALPFLANEMDAEKTTTLIYWACGESGEKIQVVGDIALDQTKTVVCESPDEWGTGTRLMPAIRYFLDRYRDGLLCVHHGWSN